MHNKKSTQNTDIFHPSILRAYDIRGTMGSTLHPETAYHIGIRFGTLLPHDQKRVAVCRDGRLSSPVLSQELIKGLHASGCQVVDIGMGPTPMLYDAVHHLKCDGGIMITGSHNPKDDNGFKMLLASRPFYGDDILKLAQTTPIESTSGDLSQHDIQHSYVQRLLHHYTAQKPLKIAIDSGNGAAGDVVEALIPHLNGEIIHLNSTIDGTFPAHHPDPSDIQNLQQLITCVKENNCDVGIAFDGDGDRIGIVDSQGRVLSGDQILLLMGRDLLKRHPHATILGDVKVSQYIFDDLTQRGANAIMCATGHSHVKVKMKETGALLAGEMSGHVFIAENYDGFDDALCAMIRLLNIFQQHDFSLTDFINTLPHMISTPELRFPMPDAEKFDFVERIKEKLRTENEAFNETDGVRVSYAGGWWLLRASNTQALVVARLEASTQSDFESISQHFQRITGLCL